VPRPRIRFATWNVNSLRARRERVLEWLAQAQPDVLCLQETKLADSAFPALDFVAAGYEGIHHGEGRWNGVAILSRLPISEVVAGFADGGDPDQEARVLTARCGSTLVTSVYVPNGRAVGHEHYEYKLRWLDRLHEHLDSLTTPDDEVVVGGDFNIAPEDRDVWNVQEAHGGTHVSGPERDRLARLLGWGLEDTFRRCHPDADRLYSWWDYRAGNFHKHRGMRIDLLLASKAVADRTRFALVDRQARKGPSPSDHAPVLIDVDAA
jgi:exodeoxyribonuclease-3